MYFDGSLEPVPLAEMAERVTVGPGRTTITHSHAAFTIRQTWLASVDEPVLAVLLDIETARPLRLRASFVPEMKPMWPASFGGQSSSWDDDAKALVLGEGLRRYYAVVGSPAFTRSSEQAGHQLLDRTLLLELDVTPQSASHHLVPFIITAADGRDKALATYRQALGSLPTLLAASDRYYRNFSDRTFSVNTAEPVLNDAFAWAKLALEKGWACNDGVGCGLVAGWGPSGASERPSFGWYFGGDAFMNSWGILDYGDFARVRGVLEFLRDHQFISCIILPSARLQRAYEFCLTTLDEDGLMSNRKAGAAAVETGALSGRVAKDVYLAGAWLAGLDGFRQLALWMNDETRAGEAAQRLERARAAMNGWFPSGGGHLPFVRLTDGSLYDALNGWQGFALAYVGLDPDKSGAAAVALNKPTSAPIGAPASSPPTVPPTIRSATTTEASGRSSPALSPWPSTATGDPPADFSTCTASQQ